MYRSIGNALGNRWNNNSKNNGIGLLNEYGIVIGKGSDQTLSAPVVSFALTLILYDPFTDHTCDAVAVCPELYDPVQFNGVPSSQSHM